MPDIISSDCTDTPLLLQPGFQDVFFKAFRTLSLQIDSTTFKVTSRSAIIWRVHRANPAGGSEQAIREICDSTRVSILNG